MHILLEKLLLKRGIKDKDELSKEERGWFDSREKILSGGEMTLEKVTKFCEVQLSKIEAQWKNLDNPPLHNERLIIAHNVYSTLVKVINAPDPERSSLEEYLTTLIKNGA